MIRGSESRNGAGIPKNAQVAALAIGTPVRLNTWIRPLVDSTTAVGPAATHSSGGSRFTARSDIAVPSNATVVTGSVTAILGATVGDLRGGFPVERRLPVPAGLARRDGIL